MKIEYTNPNEAFEEAGRRLRNKTLQEKVAAYLGGVWPPGFEGTDSPCAVYAPYLAKGSQLEVDFINKAAKTGFNTMTATYKAARYVTANPVLVDCYRAPLILPKSQRQRQWVVAPEERSGAVGYAQTIYPGQSITDYWEGVRGPVLEENGLPPNDPAVDFGNWYNLQSRRFGWLGSPRKSPYYYRALMGLYASGRAVLYDTPPTSFAETVMLPAVGEAVTALGVKPLITCVLQPEKRDWTDVSFLDQLQVERLQNSGRITT